MLVLHLADGTPVSIDVDEDRAALRLRLGKDSRIEWLYLRRYGGRGDHGHRRHCCNRTGSDRQKTHILLPRRVHTVFVWRARGTKRWPSEEVAPHLLKGFQDERYRRLIQQLVDARGRQELTQAQVATTLGAHQQFVSRYETGERRLDVVEFHDIAVSLRLDPKALIDAIGGKRST